MLAVLLLSSVSRADDGAWAQTPDAVRVAGSLTAGLADLHRSTSSPRAEGGGALGGDLHVHPYSAHGLFLGYTEGFAVFGPSASIFGAGYSLRLGNRRLTDSIGAAYLDLGPALGLVSGDGPSHAVLGGHAGLSGDVRLAFLTLGVALGYSGGLPLGGVPSRWEGALTGMIRVGFVFDVARQRPE